MNVVDMTTKSEDDEVALILATDAMRDLAIRPASAKRDEELRKLHATVGELLAHQSAAA